MSQYEPGYLKLYRSGELKRRVAKLEPRLTSCTICPRVCKVNRMAGEMGYCHSLYLPVVTAACAHRGEEPALSGTRGSGTVFFGNCNMACVYCQNYQISRAWTDPRYKETSFSALAKQMLDLQEQGCHNINFVSPTHYAPQMARGVLEAVPAGLRIPLVYNTGGYDSVATLKLLEGIIDIYLPDLRYASEEHAHRYSRIPRYVASARAAIKEMYRQVGNLVLDEDGIAQSGLIIRVLILPNGIAGAKESLTWIAHELSNTVTVSIMAQYYPAYKAERYPELARPITRAEHDEVAAIVDELGMENGWIQELGAESAYRPDFEREGHPFEGGLKG